MFGKKRKKQDQDQQPDQAPASKPVPEPPQPPQRAPMSSPPSPGSPVDHRPAPPAAPPASPMMSGDFASTKRAAPAGPSPEPPSAVSSSQDETPSTNAASEAEKTIKDIDAALAKLSADSGLNDLSNNEQPIADRLHTLAQRLGDERAKLASAEEERLNAVGQLQEAQHLSTTLQQELDEAKRALENAQQSPPEQQHDQGAQDHIKHLEHELHCAREHAQNVESERDEARRIAAESRQQLQHQSEQDNTSAEQQARIDELTSAINAMEERIATFEEHERALSEQIAADQQRLTDAEQQASTLSAERDELRQQLEEAREQAESQPAAPDNERPSHEFIGPDEFCQKRRERLGMVRNALKERTEQLYKVKQVLEHKAAQLKDADELRRQAEQMNFEAREKRAVMEQAYTGVLALRAKGATGFFILGLAVAWVVLLSVSWFGVSQFVPVEHNARVGFGCDTRGLEDPEGAAASWTEFALALPADPMFLERATQRMKTRSYSALASPSDLRTYLDESAAFESPGDGRLDVTIRGTGRDRTQRVLETLSTSIVAYANETRERRADGAPASIVVPAEAEAQPVEDPRPAIVAGVAGGLTALLLVAAIGVWRSAKRSIVESGREAIAELTPSHDFQYEKPSAQAPEGI